MIEGIARLPMEALEHIDRTCCRFEQAWKGDRPPRIVDYVDNSTGDQREALLLELLALDIDYRRKHGQPILLEHYLETLPSDRAVIERAIAQSKMSSLTRIGAAQGDITLAHADLAGAKGEIPQRIGRYRILEKLGAGGFGVVYRGFDEQLQRDVAIKVPHRDLIAPGHQANRFLREARLVASLNHAGIVPVYDAGQTESGEYYVVSKYMDGGDLAARIKWARLVYSESANIILQVADALHYAHMQGLVHRDIKPSNLLSDASGAVYIADFGEALQADCSTALTFVGTPAYMSPEQARGEGHRVDARTDCYALGVVFYELLTGQRPFRSPDVSSLLAEVISSEPPPPRQLDQQIPAELERICLKAMSKRAADRYESILELKGDLQLWIDDASSRATSAASTSATGCSPVIPKGLRSYNTTDADFFLNLLPGPRDRNGLPEVIRFWKSKIESTDPDLAFRVGVMYGPSGCGKSSLLKAGLLPHLPRGVKQVYVESRAESTELDLVVALQKTLGRDGDLLELMRFARGRSDSNGDKLLIVIDQFEQWLHAHHDLPAATLTSALRQCDGVYLQCLVLVRDDFWMPVSRLMRELELPLIDHQNALAVDLFDVAHARKVLVQFGQAYERLPGNLAQLSRSQSRFLDDAVAAITQNGAVVPIRLSVFAEMMKAENWQPATLKRVGGAEGLGVTFLDRCFVHSGAPAPCRLHRHAAREVLKALLPEPTMNIRGHVRSGGDLLQASGYEDRPEAFDELLQLLDHKLRLVTPVTPDADVVSKALPDHSIDLRYYQLTHDFMVAPIREWIAQQQRQTARGRAELCLSERATLWTAKPENRQLPGVIEWLKIRLLTRRNGWNDSQRSMMTRAGRRLAWRVTGTVLLVVLASLLGIDAVGRIRAKSAISTIRNADSGEILQVIRDLQPQRRWLAPLLQQELATGQLKPRDELKIRLALLGDDPAQLAALQSQLWKVDPRTLVTVRDGIAEYAASPPLQELVSDLWRLLRDPNTPIDTRFRAACVLAGLDPGSPNWETHSEGVVGWLLARRIDRLADWLQALKPGKRHLIGPLERAFVAGQAEPDDQTAASALATFLQDGEDLQKIMHYLEIATPSQLSPLISALEAHGDNAIDQLTAACQRSSRSPNSSSPSSSSPSSSSPSSSSPSLSLAEDLVRQISAADGVAADQFIFCQTLLWDELPELMQVLTEYGYRPIRIRPYVHQGGLRTAVLWTRDDLKWTCAYNLSFAEFERRNEELRGQGMHPEDVAVYLHDEQWQATAAWVNDTAGDESVVTLATPFGRRRAEFEEKTAQGFFPQTCQVSGFDRSGPRTHIWRKNESRRIWRKSGILTRADLMLGQTDDNVMMDVTVWPMDWADRATYDAIWLRDPGIAYEVLIFDSPAELVSRWPMLRDEGYQPKALSVASGESDPTPLTISVWHRSATVAQRDQKLAITRANSLVALMALDAADSELPLLNRSHTPDLRSYTINRVGPARVPAEVIDRYLQDRSLSPDQRQALLLSLAGYNRRWLTLEQQLNISRTVKQIYLTDVDAGVHAAARLLVHRWEVEVGDPPTRTSTTGNHRDWFTNSAGQTMIVLKYPHSAGFAYDAPVPADHRFAIADTETTVAQFDAFRPNHPFDPTLISPDECPVIGVSWYDAAAYCNWLSEQEKLPPTQWCYLRNADGDYAAGMSLAPDFLDRQGYRLPLWAEWHFAASAGSTTPYYHGHDINLLEHYAWMRKNSRAIANPVARLLPNDFGLFDVLGNVKEWCLDGKSPLLEDLVIHDDSRRTVAGGYFFLRGSLLKNYNYHENPVSSRLDNYNGFRVARTIKVSQ